MVSIKYIDDEFHKELTGKSNLKIMENLIYLDKKLTEKGHAKSVRIRYVVVPQLTDSPEHTKQLIRFLRSIKNLEAFEPLPYISFGKYKWVNLFGKYELDEIPDASIDDLSPYYTQAHEAKINVIQREI
jgi:pyruvate formate lyase activating enzyme